MSLSVLALNCTLKSGPAPSSTELLLKQVLDALKQHDVHGTQIRIADYTVLPGVKSEAEGPGDDWPSIRQQILDADILIMGTPVWMGQPSSICKRVLERMDAFLGETDDQGRLVSYGKVAAVAVVGNEDGAHHCSAELFQVLNDVGFTIPASGVTYWVGAAMQKTDYKDLKETPKEVAEATVTLARNTAHLAKLLQSQPYPGKA